MDVSHSRPPSAKPKGEYSYTYVNEHGHTRGPKYSYDPTHFENWRCLRYFLETGGHLFVNDSTYIVPVGVDLLDTDMPPRILKVRRLVMPLGIRQYVPPEQNPGYARAKAEYDDLKHKMDAENEAIMTQEIFDFLDAPKLHEETMYNTSEMQDRLASYAQKMRTIETKCGTHASAATVKRMTHVHNQYQTSHTTSHALPPESYMCLDCRAKGDHFRTACSFVNVTLVERDVTMKFGAAKMKKILQ